MIMPVQQNRRDKEEKEEEEEVEKGGIEHVRLSEEEIRFNRKITDYFKVQRKEKGREK